MVAGSLRSLSEAFNAINPLQKLIKARRILVILASVVFLLATTWLFHSSRSRPELPKPIDETPISNPSPVPAHLPAIPHPIRKLIATAREEFATTLSKQSKTLDEAVKEYRRRYKLPPPPNFDKWYEFAAENNVQLIDEYDGIYDSLLPFWSFSPKAIRQRTKKAIGSDKFLMAFFVRNGQVIKTERGPEWRRTNVTGMMQGFVQFLPDMDLAFNDHDEPRVILPHDDLTRLVQRAQRDSIPKALAVNSPRNAWSAKPQDLNDGHVEPFTISPFNEYPHQFTWTMSRLSCPIDTPARVLDFDDKPIPDQADVYATGDLGFIYNRTAFTDICLSPSLAETFGFFNLPNAWSVTHDLVPIFSASKISSFQDILYPSPWYWADKVTHDETQDPEWIDKLEKMYWRGTTTSGYSRDGAWHRQHRQRFLQKVNKPGLSKVLEYEDRNDIQVHGWHVKEVQQEDFFDLFDVRFTFIGQCSPKDCEEQRDHFNVYNDTDYQEGWRNKYLLDIDGNAFSGRFYTFLQSKSLTFKLALFREWHEELLKPWAHYVPLGVRGDDWLESLRYFNNEEDGKVQAKQIVADSTAWANQAVRHVDMEAWLFRLLLEYGRLIDDNREHIGYQVS